MAKLPPEPSLVRWFFANREQPPISVAGAGDYSELLRRNEELWTYICEHGRTPLDGWRESRSETAREDAPAIGEPVHSSGTRNSPSEPVDTPKREVRLNPREFNAEHRAAYKREWMRRYRERSRNG